MTAPYAQGKDFSSYQPPVTRGDLNGLSFAAARVSNWSGLAMGTDPNFAHNWAAFKSAGLARLAYWYLEPSVDPRAQARRLVDVVRAHGLERGDILVCDSEVPAAKADSATRDFCGQAQRAAGGGAVVAIYTNQDVGRGLTSCTRWPLWLAWPSAVAPGPAQCAPWRNWAFWQTGVVGGVDHDVFNGTSADLRAWIAARVSFPPAWKDDDLMLLVNGPAAVTPLIPPPGASKIIFVCDGGTASLRVGADSPWVVHDPVNVSWNASPVEVPLPANPVKVTVSRLDAGDANVAVAFA